MDQVKDFNARLDWVRVLATIYLVAAGVECICGLTSSSVLGAAELTPHTQMMGALLAMLAGLGSLVVLVAYVIAGIIFLILLYRVCGQAMTFSSPFKECSPALAVWYWFIPFANLFMPHQVMMHLLRSSAESAGKRFDGLAVHLWWLAFVAKAFYGAAMYFIRPHQPQALAELVSSELWIGIGGAVGVVAAALFIWMISGWRANYVQALRRLDTPVSGAAVLPAQVG
ncbi:MAG: DUF4328 domain-containing protein [Gammaproteobacteria bacterium]